jgi:hypothetical protein
MPTAFANVSCDYNNYWGYHQQPSELVFPPTQAPTTWVVWQAHGKDINSVIADPNFQDAMSLDFTLLPTAPALHLGFNPIDTSHVGPQP